MEYRKQAKKAMNDKITRMTAPLKGAVDASGWQAYDPLNADVKTGMRPISRRAYKKGGKVEDKPEGKMCGGRADRKKRQSGGKAITANSLVNRNVKEANQERDGVKHIGGMKKGGRAKKEGGGFLGDLMKNKGNGSNAISNAAGVIGMGGGLLPAAVAALMSKKDGGRTARKDGGAAKRKKRDDGGSAQMARSKMTPAQKAQQDAGMAAMSKAMVNRSGKGDYAGNYPADIRPDTLDQIRARDEDRAMKDRMLMYGAEGRKRGGKVDHDAHKAIGHAVGAAMRAYMDHEASETPEYEAKEERAARKAGGRIGKAAGGGFGEDMNNPKPKADKSSKGSKVPVINITINSEPKAPAMPIPGAPVPPLPPGMPLPVGGPPMPPGGPAAGGPAPNLGALIGAMGGGAGPGAGPAPLPRRDGGRAKNMTAGAGSGEGRLEKRDWYGSRSARAAGGGLGMTAGAGSGEGRLQKIDAYGKKAY